MSPLYILCSWCEVIPVTRLGDLCEECVKRQKKEQRKIDREYHRQLKQVQPPKMGQRNNGEK
jgi:hypothetical protein